MRVKTSGIACVASVSVRFRSKERGTRAKHHAKIAQVTLTIPLLAKFHFLALVSCGFGAKNEERESNTTRKIAQVTLTIPLFPQFHFLALVPFLVPPKPKIPFLGLSLLRNQTETLAMQANS